METEKKLEIWKPVVGYEGYYEVSNYGRVRSLDRTIYNRTGYTSVKQGKMKKTWINNRGYVMARLSKDNEKRDALVHRLVAEAFLEKSKGEEIVNHKDFNRSNNIVDNLEWCDYKYNLHYSMDRVKCSLRQKNKGRYNLGVYPRKKKDGTIKHWRVVIGKKEIGSAKTQKEAIAMRDRYFEQNDYYYERAK